jgi:hypothetical protein
MQINQVLQSPVSDSKVRLLYTNLDVFYVIGIDDTGAWPVPMSSEELEDYIPIADPFPIPIVETGSIAAQKRDEAYELLQPLLMENAALFEKQSRNQLIKQAVETSGRPRLFIVRALRRFWQRGMSPNALAPDYKQCGGGGKARRNTSTKMGRKRTVSSGEGLVVTEDVADIFRTAIETHYLVGKKVPIGEALKKVNSLLKSRYPDLQPEQLATRGQFDYFYRANYLKHEAERQRTSRKNYDKDLRPLTSTATTNNFGPGARYEIDATIVDLYLVSEADPELIVGRPVLYLVKDVFSRMIVGMYIGFENPSWVTAGMALANAFCSKVEYCASYGIEITDHDWPSVGIPASVFADRGELLSRQADTLVNRFGIQLSNSRSYRGDDKGICERHFNTIQAEFKPYVGGVVEAVNGKKRTGKRYELDAELGLSAFTEMMIHLVLRHNKSHVVKDYDFAQDMPESLPAVPVELWNWGISHRTGKLRQCEETQARINMLPNEIATVSAVGIKLQGLNYTCKEALKAGWFDRIKQNRPSKVEAAFDPRTTNVIYIRPADTTDDYWVCELSDRSRSYRGMTFVEAGQKQLERRKTASAAGQKASYAAADTLDIVESIVQRERKKKPSKSTQSASARLKGIRANRQDELATERQKTTLSRSSGSQQNTPKAPVVDIKTRAESSLDYPSLDDFLEDDDD